MWFHICIAKCMVSIMLLLLKTIGKVLVYLFLCWQDNKMYNASLYSHMWKVMTAKAKQRQGGTVDK